MAVLEEKDSDAERFKNGRFVWIFRLFLRSSQKDLSCAALWKNKIKQEESPPLSTAPERHRRRGSCPIGVQQYFSAISITIMSAIALAIIGKSNTPLYIQEFRASNRDNKDHAVTEEELFGLPARTEQQQQAQQQQQQQSPPKCSLRQQFVLHAALDRFEQLAGPHPGCGWRKAGVTGTEAMWVGLLLPDQDMRVYGYQTTTQIKFLLTVEDDAGIGDQRTVDETIKRLCIKLHRLYVEYTLNPFSPISGPIESARFTQKVNDCVTAYNRALH